MWGLESTASFGGVGAVELGVSAGFFDQPEHGIRQRTGIICKFCISLRRKRWLASLVERHW